MLFIVISCILCANCVQMKNKTIKIKANVAAYLDSRRVLKDGTYPVKIRVTSQRKRVYYPTPYNLTISDFAETQKKKPKHFIEIAESLQDFERKANDIIKKLPVFTFDLFENLYLENRGASDSIKFALEQYANELRSEKRVGTAIICESAAKSLESFKPDLKFADITKRFLVKYENWMLENERSINTVGIYLRALRTVFNLAKIDKSLYPFGEESKGLYSIPNGKNIKKSLTMENIAKIYHYKANTKTDEAMAKDYWIFLYLCNGMNVKDFCLLKRKNIEGKLLKFERAKTKRSRKESKTIEVSLKPQTLEIIKKWGTPSISPESYIFPHLYKGVTAVKEREIVQKVTYIINRHMRAISKELEIGISVTSYFARHSFASILKRSGTNVSFISDALGHSSVSTTESYLGGFEEEAIHKTTDALTAGF